MNIVETVARMIDAEGAYAKAFGGTDASSPAIPFTTRQKYFQAKYEMQAIEILKLAAGAGTDKIKADLIQFEKDGWKRLGVPLEQLPEADAIIAAKYA